MTQEPQMKFYSEKDIADILESLDKMQHNLHVVAEAVVAKAHELNVSGKKIIKLTKEEGWDILDGYLTFGKILNQQAGYLEDLIRQMVPSLRMARDIGPLFSDALKNAQQTTPVTVTETIPS